MKILEVKDVSQSFDGRKIIEDIELHLCEGEVISLLGLSGVGKSTLFHIIAGVAAPESGSILLRGRDITGRPGHISYMLQKDLLIEQKDILTNVSLPLIIRGMKKQEAKKRAASHFDRFGLQGTESRYPNELSGGMRQRAALLRTYLSSESVILLDEPFSALDAVTKKELHDWYLKMNRELKLSTLFITHDIDEAICLSDRIYMMTGSPGHIQWEIPVSRPDTEDFTLTPIFLEYKKMLLSRLNP